MEVKTYRAATMQQALNLVRAELGPDAAVLHTREVRAGGLLRWLKRGRQIEVTASHGVNVPSRLPQRATNAESRRAVAAYAEHQAAPQTEKSHAGPTVRPSVRPSLAPAHLECDYRAKFREDLHGQHDDLQSMVERLCQRPQALHHDLPESLFRVFAALIEADINEDSARGMLNSLRSELRTSELADSDFVLLRVAARIEQLIPVSGPLGVWPGRRRLVALVGPTGVGKTTTIAKLAAHYRLREKLRVGLITVDTYRIAAVEQLRTYADIIDLPMQVVATPREMREAIARMQDLDLVLLDTAGRSPRDEVRIQELKSMLAEAAADEVHLVVSSVASPSNLITTAEKFAAAGTTSLILTKLDEATSLGHLLPLMERSRLPLSYLTNGQNVPDDIAVADARRLARAILRMDR